MERNNLALVTTIGFLGGCLIFLVAARAIFGSLPHPPYTGDPADQDLIGHLEQQHRLKMTMLSGFAAVVGGVAGSIYAARIQQHGFRFSLRGLLIVTTVVAVLLGWISYVVR